MVTTDPVETFGRSSAPFESGERWAISHGEWTMEVDPVRGARICTFSLQGENVLTGPDVDPNNHGSTFWTSPQGDWEWPPVAEVDSGPYAVVDAETSLLCAGALSPKLGILVTKRFSVVAERNCALVEYSMSNQTGETLRYAPWEISRVRGGLTFFETGEGRLPNPPLPEPRVQEFGGVTWFPYDRAQIDADQKLFAHSGAGWLAHVCNDLVLIKQFEPVPLSKQAPGEAMVEIFASGEKDYVEIEQQGPYTKIGPWKTFSWQVHWFVRRLPRVIEATPGNMSLVHWVKQQLGVV